MHACALLPFEVSCFIEEPRRPGAHHSGSRRGHCEYEFIIVGSQAILGPIPYPPDVFKFSAEADIYRVPANCVVRRGRDYFAGEKEVGARNELSIFATIGPAASLAFLTSTHSGSTTNLPHLTSRSARLSQTSM